MLSRPDLDAICLRLEDPFEGSKKALEELKGHALETRDDAVFYARRVLDLYETVIGHIDRDLDDARQRAKALNDQYSIRREHRDSLGFLHESDPGFSLNEIDERLSSAASAAQLKKEEVTKTLQRELAGRSVDVRTKRHMVILKTNDGVYGFYLHDAGRYMKRVNHIPTPFGSFYWLVGKTYHIPKIVGR